MGILPNLQNFRDDDTLSFEEWLEGFEDSVSLLTGKILERQRIALLKIHLEGLARHHFDSLTASEKLSYESACSSLIRAFPGLGCKRQAQKELRKLSQGSEERVGKYADRVHTIVIRATTGEPASVQKYELLSTFVNGLNSKYRLTVKSTEPKTFDQALSEASRLEETMAGEGTVSLHLASLLGTSKRRTTGENAKVSVPIGEKHYADLPQDEGCVIQAVHFPENGKGHLRAGTKFEDASDLPLPLKPLREKRLVMSEVKSHVIYSIANDCLKPELCLRDSRAKLERTEETLSEVRVQTACSMRMTYRKYMLCSKTRVIMPEQRRTEVDKEGQKKAEILAALIVKMLGYIVLAVSAGLLVEQNAEELFEHKFRWCWNPGIGAVLNPNCAC